MYLRAFLLMAEDWHPIHTMTRSGYGNVQTGAVLQVITDPSTAVAYSPDGRLIASGSWDNSARVWDVATGLQVSVYTGHLDPISRVAFLGRWSTDSVGRLAWKCPCLVGRFSSRVRKVLERPELVYFLDS